MAPPCSSVALRSSSCIRCLHPSLHPSPGLASTAATESAPDGAGCAPAWSAPPLFVGPAATAAESLPSTAAPARALVPLWQASLPRRPHIGFIDACREGSATRRRSSAAGSCRARLSSDRKLRPTEPSGPWSLCTSGRPAHCATRPVEPCVPGSSLRCEERIAQRPAHDWPLALLLLAATSGSSARPLDRFFFRPRPPCRHFAWPASPSASPPPPPPGPGGSLLPSLPREAFFAARRLRCPAGHALSCRHCCCGHALAQHAWGSAAPARGCSGRTPIILTPSACELEIVYLCYPFVSSSSSSPAGKYHATKSIRNVPLMIRLDDNPIRIQ